MKISEAIKALSKIIEMNGDIELFIYPYDGQTCVFPVASFDIGEHGKEKIKGVLVSDER